MALETAKIRNVAVVGHGGVGKTSLVEAMLFAAGAVTRLGRVDDGTTTTDFDPDEIKRKISINTSIAYCDAKGHRINLVDTPGYGDFIADARAGSAGGRGAPWWSSTRWPACRCRPRRSGSLPASSICPAPSSSTGSTASARTSSARWSRWGAASRAASSPARPGRRGGRVPRLRRPGDPARDALRRRQGRPRPPSRPRWPTAWRSGARSWWKPLPRPTTTCWPSTSRRARWPSRRCSRRCGPASARARSCRSCARRPPRASAATPCSTSSCTSSRRRPTAARSAAPTSRPRPRGLAAPIAKAPVTALVFKTLSDPHIGKLSLFRVYSGTLRADSTLLNIGRGARERMGHVSWLQGKTQKNVEALGPGEIGVVPEAQGDADGRHPGRRGAPVRAAPHHVPGAGHLLRHPAQDARRRGQDLHRRWPASPRRIRPSTTTSTPRPSSC